MNGLLPFTVDPPGIPSVWDEVAPMLAAGLETGMAEMTAADLRTRLEAGTAYLIVGRDEAGATHAAMAVEFYESPAYRVGHVIAVGGSGVVFSEAGWAIFKEWLKMNDCKYVQGWCTESNARLWRRIGMRPVYQVMRGEL